MGIISEDTQIINIQVRQQLTRADIRTLQLTSRLDNNATLKNDLFIAYGEYMKQFEYIITRYIKLYQYIQYTILDENSEFYAQVKLHIGDVVMIKEEDDELYAIVKMIFTHKYNDGNIYAFIWIDWLKDIKRIDSLLRCPIFEKQKELDIRWYHIYPISVINDISKVHFLHACHSSCSADMYDTTNIQYFKNNFFYKLV
jgi:hypothetical protein